MNVLLIYIVKVMAIQAVLYMLYMLVFHKSGRHQINRVFILSSLLLSFFIPLLQFPTIKNASHVAELQQAEIWFAAVEREIAQVELIPLAKVQESNSIFQFVVWFFLFLVVFLFIKLGVHYYQLHRLKRKSKLISSTWYKLYETPFRGAFSFFRSVYLPKHIFDTQAFEQVLLHECSHVKMRHSIDRLFMECLLAILWFNPILYWFRKRLIEVHEFQADESVVQAYNDPISYQEILYSQLAQTSSLAFANHFKLSIIKNRIKMINKTKKRSGWVYSFSLPVLMLLVFIFSDKEHTNSLVELTENVKTLVPDLGTMEDYTPSILPLRATENVDLTSNFAKRIDPLTKERTMHHGIDLRSPQGNAVMATASGVVVEADYSRKYGYKIEIDHNGLYTTAYAHLSVMKVKVGEKVKRGGEIALSGTTGMSAGPHLHYEVKEKGKGFVDPLLFISDYDFNLKANKNQPSEELY
jgi:murein DD-endopeptidase MepM/ murein hydrolase activator NlpD